MDVRRHTLGRVAVNIELRPPSADLTGEVAALRDELHAFVEQLVDGLGIPAGVDLAIERAPADGRPPRPYTARVDGQPCRIERRRDPASTRSRRQLVAAIAADLCRNRALFLTPSLCERLYAEWAAEPGRPTAFLPASTFQELLRQLVDLGIRIDRLRDLPLTREDAYDPQRCRCALEDAVTASGAVGWRVLTNEAEARRLRATIPRGDERTFDRMLEWAAHRLLEQRGVLLPPPETGIDRRLRDAEFRLQINDLRWPPFEGLAADEWLVTAREERLVTAGIAAAPAFEPESGRPCWRVSGDDAMLERTRQAGRTRGGASFIAGSLLALASRHAAHLVTTGMVRGRLDDLRVSDPVLVEAAAGRFDVFVLTLILRDLVSSGVSIRDMRSVLEVLLDLEGSKASAMAHARSGAPPDIAYWADWIRAGLKRHITHAHANGGTLGVYRLAPALEDRLAGAAGDALTKAERERLVESMLGVRAYPERPIVVLAQQAAARRLRALIGHELPDVAVIGYQELSVDVDVRPYGWIGEDWIGGE